MDADPAVGSATLNEHQQRHLRVSCQYVDKLLTAALRPVAPPPRALRSRATPTTSLPCKKGSCTNSRRVAADLDERVLESRRQLEIELRARLAGGLASAEQAIAQARSRRTEGEAAVARAEAQLDDIRSALLALGAGGLNGTD